MSNIPAREKRTDSPNPEQKPAITPTEQNASPSPLVNEKPADKAPEESEVARLMRLFDESQRNLVNEKSQNGKLRGELSRLSSEVEDLRSNNANLTKLARIPAGSEAPTRKEIYLAVVTGAMSTINPLTELDNAKLDRLATTLAGMSAVMHLKVSTHKNFLPSTAETSAKE